MRTAYNIAPRQSMTSTYVVSSTSTSFVNGNYDINRITTDAINAAMSKIPFVDESLPPQLNRRARRAAAAASRKR